MAWLPLLAYLFAGAFLANAVPHLVSGMMGQPFQTPFATPPGEGLSSSTVNFLWGFLNLAIGYGLLRGVGDFERAAGGCEAAGDVTRQRRQAVVVAGGELH